MCIYPLFPATNGYMLYNQLRPGNQHCQKQPPEFIARCMDTINTLGLSGQTLLRLDSGNDAAENFTHFPNSYFIVKGNLRKESPEQWLATARGLGQLENSRDGKNVYTEFVHHLRPAGSESDLQPAPVAFEVTERLNDHDGNIVLQPDIEVNIFWTNFPCAHASEVIELYHDHGTSEQFHSELKSDLDVERLSSGKDFTSVRFLSLILYLHKNFYTLIDQPVMFLFISCPLLPHTVFLITLTH